MAQSPFERLVFVTALCVLLATLTIIAMTMIKGTSAEAAKKAAACPDYWYSSNYMPCESTQYGCCTDSKVPKRDAEGSNCGAAPCSDTPEGCCPDGVTNMSAGCPLPQAMCYNTHKLGTCLAPVNFSDPKYEGTVGLCEKQKFAKNCKISWEGVSNVPDTCS